MATQPNQCYCELRWSGDEDPQVLDAQGERMTLSQLSRGTAE